MAAGKDSATTKERRPTSADGIIVVDKPAGMTSHDVVARLRRLCGTRAVGHGGTLDPMATGVLICGIGKGTKLLTYVSGADKSYEATIRLGISTSTDDADGEVTQALGADAATLGPLLDEAIATLSGDIMQVPTTVSAIKVAGERAYALARQGKEVRLAVRPVRVERFAVERVAADAIDEVADGQRRSIGVVDLDVSVTVSSGTYVRALARDMGAALGVGGHLTKLRRTWIGGVAGLPGFSIADAVPLADLATTGDKALARGEALPTTPLGAASARFLPTRQLTAAEVTDIGYGRFIEPSSLGDVAVAGITADGQLAALLNDVTQRGQLRAKPTVVFAPDRSHPGWGAGADGGAGPGSVVTFGSFDGVQRGHQALLGEVKRIAAERGLQSVALTFDPHPGVFHGSRPGLQLIQGVPERVAAVKAQGIDVVSVIPYEKEFAAQSAAEFVANYLVGKYGAKVVVLGSDARFGARNSGDLNVLRELGRQHGFEVVEFSGIGPGDGETRWSSTLARHAIAAGNMPQARQVLGRHHAITGIVVHGDHRGRTLGFPTANLADTTGAVPPDGVYAGWLTELPAGERWAAAISIGTNPTFTDAPERRVEAFVLDKTGIDLYGRRVKVEFAQQIRPTLKFDSVAELVAQMHADVAKVRALTAPPATGS